tara:strand:+ start:1207 stop:1710 length:504 start_codon:yes stop_codon:yes gene_type:complete
MTVFSVVGVLVKLIMGNYQGHATASVYGYGLIAISLICIMFNDFALAQREISLNRAPISFVLQMFKSSIPILVTLGVLLWLITINIIYYDKINDNDVAKEYSKYSLISTILVLGQIIVIFQLINSKLISKMINKTNNIGGVVYILSFINIIFISILTIILKFFSTDG